LLAKAELNYYPEEVLEKQYINNPKSKKEKRAVKNKTKLNTLVKLACLSCAIIIMITSLFILLRYAKITKIRMDVTELEKQKIELEKTKLDLVADLEGIKSSLKISEDAVYKLGMSYPQEGQIVYVSVDDVSNEVVDNGSITSQLGKVISLFSSLF